MAGDSEKASLRSASERDLEGRVFVITGATSGIGEATARALARRGATLWLANRSEDRSKTLVDALRRDFDNGRVEFVTLDLADLGSVRRGAAALLEHAGPIHGLINNAGVAGQRGATAQGFEIQFGVNHLGHFLLTHLLRERLAASAPARVVTVASEAHRQARGIDWDALREPTRTRTAWREYAVSKLANLLFSAELARRLRGTGVTTYAVHPGVVASGLWRRLPAPVRGTAKLFMISNEKGARTSVYCVTRPELASETGLYYAGCAQKRPTAVAEDRALAEELWRRSLQYCELA